MAAGVGSRAPLHTVLVDLAACCYAELDGWYSEVRFQTGALSLSATAQHESMTQQLDVLVWRGLLNE